MERSPSPVEPLEETPRVSAISGSSSLVALRGRHLHLAGSYQSEGIWIGAYVDDNDLRLVRRAASLEPPSG